MKREVNRRRVLPAFQLDIQDLGLLWSRCIALFDAPEEVHASLTVELETETLKFSTFHELEEFSGLPDRVTKLSLWLSRGDRHISIRSPSLIGTLCEVHAGGESEAWCAGAVETVFAFISNHRASYGWFVTAPLGWILVALVYGLPFVLFLAQKFVTANLQISQASAYAWSALVASITLLYLSRNRLFPLTVLEVRESRGFVRRNVAELGLAVAVVSLVLTVIGWFVSK